MKWNHKAIARARKLREKKQEIRNKLKLEKRYATDYREVRGSEIIGVY